MDIDTYVKENPAVKYDRSYYLANRDRILGHKPSVEWAGKSPEQRFWTAVKKTDKCWEWTRSGNGIGYGIISYRAKRMYAHRFSWLIHKGSLPRNLHVCHRCDNPKCVRPSHLFLGTQSENMRDCVAKGRATRKPVYGEDNNGSKLTEKQVLEIKSMFKAGKRRIDIARSFGVSETLIGYIKAGKLWGWLK